MKNNIKNKKNDKEKNLKITIIALAVLIIIVLAITYYASEKNEELKSKAEYYAKKEYNSKEDFKTVEEVLIFKGVEYIKDEKASDDRYNVDIYAKLKYPLYTEEEDKEQYYTNMMVLLANVLNYQNFRVIDNEKQIILGTTCDSKNKVVSAITVNGDRNYWRKQRNKTNITKIEAPNTTDMQIQSTEIKQLINNEWKRNKLGIDVTKNKIGNYEIFSEKGLEVRTIYKKVFNIVFTKQYNKPIVNNIEPGTDLYKVEEILGTPIYGATDIGIMGYKSNDIYIFFTTEDISVYRVEKEYEGLEDFFVLIEKFERDQSVKEFVSGITDIWPDYDVYRWNKNYVDLRYTLKGVKIQFNVSNMDGIIYDQNYTAEVRRNLTLQDIKNDITKLPKYTYFENESNIWELEYQRFYDKTEVDDIDEEIYEEIEE